MKSFFSNPLATTKAPTDAERSAAERNLTFVHIQRIAPGTTRDELTALFEKHGKVTSANLYVDAAKILPGFGYVKFENHADAVEAIKELNGSKFQGAEVRAGFAAA